jgi:hypothetical protein
MVINEGSYVGRHPLAFLESFHGVGGQPDIELFSQQAERDAVVVFVDLDLVVDVNGGQFPLGVFIALFGKSQRVGSIEELKEFAARLFEFTQPAAV